MRRTGAKPAQQTVRRTWRRRGRARRHDARRFTMCSGKFKQDLCWGMSTNSHFFSSTSWGGTSFALRFALRHFALRSFALRSGALRHAAQRNGLQRSGARRSGALRSGALRTGTRLGAGHFCFMCQACALLDSPNVPISAQRTNRPQVWSHRNVSEKNGSSWVSLRDVRKMLQPRRARLESPSER